MKLRIVGIALLFAVLLSGCQRMPFGKDEPKMKKVLIIGNSHSVDAFHLLSMAYADQNPGEQLTLGVLYYSGCSIDKHVNFANNGEAVYRYYLNTDGKWSVKNKKTMESVLKDQPWDTVLLQAAKSDLDETLNLDGRRALEAYVDKHLTEPHRFVWHTSWPNPNEEVFFSADAEKQPPEGYKENLIQLYGFDPLNQYRVLTDKAAAHILPDKTYSKAVCTGTAIMYAHLSEALPQTALWRDYTHLNDYGRLTAAYALLAQLTGKPIEAIGIDRVPAQMRHSMYQDLGDLVLTEEQKALVVRAANYAFEQPFSIPPTAAE